jgi:hypothetical protein
MDKDMQKHGHPRYYQILDEIADLHSRKNRDYATQEDPLQNFRRVALLCRLYNLITPGHEALKVSIIYQLKQFDAALKLLREDQVGMVEGFGPRMRDNAVYSVIDEILYEENEPLQETLRKWLT